LLWGARFWAGTTASARNAGASSGVWTCAEGIDFSIYLLGAFERSTVRALQKLVIPGSVVFDIGANIGAHTLGLARSVGPAGRVFAIEPSDFAFAKLKRNLALNPELESRTHAHQILLAAEIEALLPPTIYASWPLLARKQCTLNFAGVSAPRRTPVSTLWTHSSNVKVSIASMLLRSTSTAMNIRS